MKPHFDIYPYVGALPVRFGTPRCDVPGILGSSVRHASRDADSFDFARVAYYGSDEVAELGFAPGKIDLSFLGQVIWSGDRIHDPVPYFLAHDPAPKERLGFLVFTKIGVTCTGFHDDQHSQRAVTVFRRGLWDVQLAKAQEADLGRYKK